VRRVEAWDGESPREKKAQESQDVGRAGKPVADIPTREGLKPLKRCPDRIKNPTGQCGWNAALGKRIARGEVTADKAAQPSPGQALKGKPRERARLRHTGEMIKGEKRRDAW